LWWRLTKADQETRPFQFWDEAAETSTIQINPRTHLSFGNTFILSPTTIVNVLLGLGRWEENQDGHGFGFDIGALGFPSSFVSQVDSPTPPQVQIGGLTLGNNRHLMAPRTTYSGQVNLSKEFQSHSLRAGFSYEPSLMNSINVFSAFFTFNNLQTAGPDADTRATNVGNGIASFLLGTGNGGRAPRAGGFSTNDLSWALYAQDAWKVNTRLTVNLGLRYEVQHGRTERYNRLNYFDFDIANSIGPLAGMPDLRGGLVFTDENNRNVWETPYNNIAPRIGLAYRATDRMVVRAGYGIFYMKSVNVGAPTSSAGFSIDTPWLTSQDGGRTPYRYFRDPFPEGLIDPTGAANGALTQVGQGVSAFSRNRPTPYMQQFSFDIQYQFSGSTVLELGYAGSQGRKLTHGFAFDMNQIAPQYLSLGPALIERVPNPFYGVLPASNPLGQPTTTRGQLHRRYPQFGAVNIVDMPGASSSFNAFTANFTKRLSHGLTLIGSYRFSKAIDNASESITFGTGDRGRNFHDLSLDRSISGHDRPHIAVLTFMYALPLGKGRTFGTRWHPVVDALLGGWSLSGLYNVGSGQPLMFSAPNNVTFGLGGGQYPNISDRKLLKVDNQTLERWFNTAVISAPPDYTWGNAPRWVGEVREHHENNLNLAVNKTFVAKERFRFVVRGEFYNALNRARFDAPDTGLGSRNLGVVSSTLTAPRQIQLALRMLF
jgi:hypothetical protein